MTLRSELAEMVISLRLQMLVINEAYKAGKYKIPIHLAFGHEAIAVATNIVMGSRDQLICSHRNIHYNLAREQNIEPVMDEYFLREKGLGGGRLGSMNLANSDKNILYSSSILGNNLPVACGCALAQDLRESTAVTFVVSGDGGMEEGSFYESLVFLKSHNLKSAVIVENNDWSLATRVSERRCPIDLNGLGKSLGIDYIRLSGNDCSEYVTAVEDVVARIHADRTPAIIEVDIATLGDWVLRNEEHPTGKLINYHAGPAPTVEMMEMLIIDRSVADPVYVLEQQLGVDALSEIATRLRIR